MNTESIEIQLQNAQELLEETLAALSVDYSSYRNRISDINSMTILKRIELRANTVKRILTCVNNIVDIMKHARLIDVIGIDTSFTKHQLFLTDMITFAEAESHEVWIRQNKINYLRAFILFPAKVAFFDACYCDLHLRVSQASVVASTKRRQFLMWNLRVQVVFFFISANVVGLIDAVAFLLKSPLMKFLGKS